MLYSVWACLVIGTHEYGSPIQEHLISHMAQGVPRRMGKGKGKENKGINKHHIVGNVWFPINKIHPLRNPVNFPKKHYLRQSCSIQHTVSFPRHIQFWQDSVFQLWWHLKHVTAYPLLHRIQAFFSFRFFNSTSRIRHRAHHHKKDG